MAVGMALIVIGALILVPSGLCTAIMGIGAITELVAEPKTFLADLSDVGPFALGVLAAVAVGAVLLRTGLSMRRRR